MTLRESLQAEVAKGEAELAALRAKIQNLEASAGAWLDREAQEVKSFFAAIKDHLEKI